jgi:hypothetical protein
MKRYIIQFFAGCTLIWCAACSNDTSTNYSENIAVHEQEDTMGSTITDIVVDDELITHAQEPEIPVPLLTDPEDETAGNGTVANGTVSPVRIELVEYAATLEGIPYKVMGKDEQGFDCSGFVAYVFNEFDIDIPSSSRHMIEHGEEIPLEEALPGDILFFTGTDASVREPGHVGIVVSQPGEPLTFIHSSSSKKDPCVKYSEMSENYQTRYLATKRVLEN